MEKALESFRKNPNQRLEEVAKNINTSTVAAKAVCEFLREKGELLERRREQYYLIT
jgi:predicted transcriptional regulator